MSATMEQLRGRQPIRVGAKAIGKSRAYVRKLIDQGKLTGYWVGGSDEKPWLEVDIEELERVHRQESIYRPKGVTKTPKKKMPPGKKLHPAAAAM